jgi:hypothetical protein
MSRFLAASLLSFASVGLGCGARSSLESPGARSSTGSAQSSTDGPSSTACAGPFSFVRLPPVTLGAGRIGGSVVADVDGDGRPDIVSTLVTQNKWDSGQIVIQRNQGQGALGAPMYQEIPFYGVYLVAADLNGDGKPDLALANPLDNQVAVLLGEGGGTFGAPVSYAVGTLPLFLAAADLNGDGRLDLATENYGGVSVLPGQGQGTFAPASGYVVGHETNALVTMDANGDGKLDLLVSTEPPNVVDVLLNQGDGTFAPPVAVISGPQLEWMAAADMNGDGAPDLVGVIPDDDNTLLYVQVFTNQGQGSFSAGPEVGAGLVAGMVAVADFDGDGRPDVAALTGGSSDTVTLLHGQGGGALDIGGSFDAVPLSYFLLAEDLNGDGKPDLVYSTFGLDPTIPNTVGVLLNGCFP